jgi:hypothetical protein
MRARIAARANPPVTPQGKQGTPESSESLSDVGEEDPDYALVSVETSHRTWTGIVRTFAQPFGPVHVPVAEIAHRILHVGEREPVLR